MPTLCQLVGATPRQDPQWDGSNIWPLLAELQDEVARKPFYWNFRGNLFGVRRDDWKLIANDQMSPDQVELFDLSRDPGETRDLAAGEPERVHEMLEMIASERRLDGVSRRLAVP